MAFLEIVTRHMASRDELLKRCQASLEGQTDDDWVHTLLIDNAGRGVEWATRNMGRYAPHLEGEYIWILDDDDECVCDTLVADCKAIAAETDADVIMVKGEFNRHGVLPDGGYWGGEPVMGHVGMPNFILRRSVWQAHAGGLPMVREADYWMIRSVFEHGGYRIHWHDKVVVRVEMARFGAPA